MRLLALLHAVAGPATCGCRPCYALGGLNDRLPPDHTALDFYACAPAYWKVVTTAADI